MDKSDFWQSRFQINDNNIQGYINRKIRSCSRIIHVCLDLLREDDYRREPMLRQVAHTINTAFEGEYARSLTNDQVEWLLFLLRKIREALNDELI